MEETLQEFHHLKIQLEEIKSATNDFTDKPIGGGGFGKVYEGELSLSKGPTKVAIKRLNPDPKHGQGKTEFLKEIKTLSKYKHENLINLLGFCYEKKEKEVILVYEYASRQSLEKHLASPDLTWKRRLKICLDAAKGLSHLHDPRGTHERLIHRDMKSANILLDDDWNAKVSDFGLSIMGPANGKDSVVVVNTAGTYGYCDQQYASTQTLTKESDVYSFGVVLFEVLCGKLCCLYKDNILEKYFVPTWIKSYKEKKLNDIIFKHDAIPPLEQGALEAFSDIAYRCLKVSRQDRPTMEEVVTELETAIEIQECSEWDLVFDYEEMTKSAYSPLNYRSKGELMHLLITKGVLLNDGNTWFSLNKKGEHCEMISSAGSLDTGTTQSYHFTPWGYVCSDESSQWRSEYNSRFAVGTYDSRTGWFKTRVKTQFLSPGITYTMNLVFSDCYPDKTIFIYNEPDKYQYIDLNYQLEGETETSISYLAFEREDGWWACELYQFTSDHRIVDLEILINGVSSGAKLNVEGIEFRPLEKVGHKESEDQNIDMQPVSDSDKNWEEKMPPDFEDLMKWSTERLQWVTKKEAYSIFRKGFLIDNGEKWVSLDKNGKKSLVLSAKTAGFYGFENKLPLHESRFGKDGGYWSLESSLECKIEFQLLSPETTYASYLIYKLPEDQSEFVAPILVDCKGLGYSGYIYLVSPQTPVLRPKDNQSTHTPVNRPKIKGVPRQRNDGWMEVLFWEFQTANTAEEIRLDHVLTPRGNSLYGHIIGGVEFRPI